MTNAKYHRRERALTRLASIKNPDQREERERDRLEDLVYRYRSGALRAKNGRGAGLHQSGASA